MSSEVFRNLEAHGLSQGFVEFIPNIRNKRILLVILSTFFQM